MLKTSSADRRTDPLPGAVYLLLAAVLLCLPPATSHAAASVRIVFLGDTDGDAWRGARQGIDEANVQGRFLGLDYELVAADDQAGALAAGAVAIVADVSALRLSRLADAAAGVPVFNVGADDDELREACLPNLLHTIPSLAMRDDAVQQWRRKRPDGNAEARAWHPTFRKYAAAQLNKRYEDTFARPMSDVAWAGWAATKLVADTIARGTDPAALLDALRGDLAFDGQKGSDLSFRTTGQLRQPLLLVSGDKIVGEAPVRGVVAAGNLDSLGLSDCHK